MASSIRRDEILKIVAELLQNSRRIFHHMKYESDESWGDWMQTDDEFTNLIRKIEAMKVK
jgi:hypothetical protein